MELGTPPLTYLNRRGMLYVHSGEGVDRKNLPSTSRNIVYSKSSGMYVTLRNQSLKFCALIPMCRDLPLKRAMRQKRRQTLQGISPLVIPDFIPEKVSLEDGPHTKNAILGLPTRTQKNGGANLKRH